MTRKYFSQTNLDFRILDIQNSVFQTGRRPARRGLYSQKTLIQNTCKKITIHFGFVYYDWLRLINIWAGVSIHSKVSLAMIYGAILCFTHHIYIDYLVPTFTVVTTVNTHISPHLFCLV